MAHPFVFGAGQSTSIPSYQKARERGLPMYESLAERRTREQALAGAYFKGLSGLSKEDRAQWEQEYQDKIKGLSYSEKDNVFRNSLFIKHFKDSQEDWMKDAWENKSQLTIDQRDALFARLASTKDLDGKSTDKETPLNVETLIGSPRIWGERAVTKLQSTLRDDADRYLTNKSNAYKDLLYSSYASLPQEEKDSMLSQFEDFSNKVSTYYSTYKDTNKLPLNKKRREDFMLKYLSYEQAGGSEFAAKAIARDYQNIVADNQSNLEKAWNSGAQFIDSAAGMIIRAAGMAGAALGIGLEEGESWVDNVVDNQVTRYGDNIATTNAWGLDSQKELKESGLSDNPILNRVDQQNSLLSWNSPFELFGQYGFIFASTVLSFGGSAIVDRLARGTAWAAKVAMGGKTLNSTATGVKFLKGITRSKNIGNLFLPGAVGTVEGGMNAALTKEASLESLNQEIQERYKKKVDADIVDYCKYNRILDKVEDMQSDPNIRQQFERKYASQIKADKAAAQESANTAMYWDFLSNSLINGMINATLQAGQQAPKVQNALRKVGLGSSDATSNAIMVVREGDRWVAKAKHMTKKQATMRRLREALGEGLEEYSQEISSAFGQAYASDKMQQYIDNKYGANPGATAAQNDFWRSFHAGMEAASKSAMSFEAIKAGLYGALSTAFGGPNIKVKTDSRGNVKFAGVTWRSAFGPLFNNRERNSINEQREKMADYFNRYFSDEVTQRAFFNAGGTSEWLTQYQQDLESNDEKAARDSRIGARFSQIITLNELEGTGFYEAAMASLGARARFNASNLDDPESEESKAVEQFLLSPQNRSQNISREEALNTIKKNAEDMIALSEMVDKETRSIEKLFGENIDKDVKASMVFNRVVINDYKQRIGQLDNDIKEVVSEINSQEDNIPNASLSEKSKRIIARFGSLSNANKELDRLKQQETEVKAVLDELKEMQSRGTLSKEDGATLAMAEAYYRGIVSDIESIESARQDYNFEAKQEKTEVAEGIYQDVATDTTVLSASDIMGLSASDRAFMLDPKHRNRYSAEQQLEIDKVINIGTSIHQDFVNKITDRHRVERDYKAALNSQAALLYSPKALNSYVARVKHQAQIVMLQRKNDELFDLANAGNYSEFAERLDDVYNRGDIAEIGAVEEMLSSGVSWRFEADFKAPRAMYERYSNENEKKAEIYEWASRNNIFEENDPKADVFASVLDYLSNRGVDITDTEAGAQSLLDMQVDEEGNPIEYSFEQHISRANSRASLEEQVSGYNSIEETIQDYKDIMSRYNEEVNQRNLNNEAIEVSPTPAEASNPPINPTPKGPSLFEIGGATPEAGHLNAEGERVGGPTVAGIVEQGATTSSPTSEADVNPQEESSGTAEAGSAPSIIDTYIENSNEEVAKSAEVALRLADNSSSFSEESRTQAREIIESLANNSFDSVQEFTDALTARATAIQTTSEDSQIADLLKHIAAKINKAQADSKAASNPLPKGPISPFFDRRRRAINTQARRVSHKFLPGGPNAGMVSSVNIAAIKQSHPDSHIVKYYEKYGIEDALREGVLTRDSEVFFITDDSLTEDTKASLEEAGLGYTDNDLPIVAVVEVDGGPITINVNGKDKHFQPVSIMASTGSEYSAGSNNMAPIRSRAVSNTGISIVNNEDGTPITTKLYKPIIADANFDSTRKGQQNNNVLDVGYSDLSEQERGTPQGHQKARKDFIKGLYVVPVGDNRKKIIFRIDKLNGEYHPIDIFIAPVQRTVNREGQTVQEAANDTEGLINFNSRTRRAAGTIKAFIEGFSDEDLVFISDPEGNVNPLGETEGILNALASSLENQVSNFINIPSKAGWSYKITGTSDAINNSRVYTISLVNNDTSIAPIPLTTFYQGMSEEESKKAQQEFLRNLLMDSQGEVRMVNERDSFAKWQVPHSDVEKAKTGDSIALKNLHDIYDDGYLEVSASNISFKYIIKGIALQNPFKQDGSPVYQTVANQDNATPASPINQPAVLPTGQITRGGTIIDGDSGAVVEGAPIEAKNEAAERAKEIVDRIISNPKGVRLSDDGTTYTDNEGTRYARVTSIIAADLEAGERFDPDSPWALPSSNIGTGIDEFVRDFFAGNVKDLNTYANTTQEQLQKFSEELAVLKNSLEAQGLTIVPRDITLTGQVEVADSNNKIHTINVAGTIDLLAYDGKGNFYIFDMKTYRSKIDDTKKAKYARQMSLYKELLEKEYGVQVKSLGIIHIKVDYPAPAEAGGGAAYSVSASSPNQLLIDGKEFRSANPKLNPTIGVPYSPLRVVYDKLSDIEKEMLAGIEEAINTGTGTVETPIEPVTPVEAQVASPMELPINPTLGVGVDMEIGGGLFDTDFSGGMTWNMMGRLTPIPHHLQWGNLSSEQRAGLEAMGLSDEVWSQLEDQEMEHKLGCL